MRLKKFLTVALLAVFTFLSCDRPQKAEPLSPALEDNTVYVLNKYIDEVKSGLAKAQQFQTRGQRTRAAEQFKTVQRQLDQLQLFLIPLLNAKAHISTAFHMQHRKDLSASLAELHKAQNQILAVKEKSSGTVLKAVNSSLLSLESIDQALAAKKTNLQSEFNRIALQLDELILDLNK